MKRSWLCVLLPAMLQKKQVLISSQQMACTIPSLERTLTARTVKWPLIERRVIDGEIVRDMLCTT
eukprot:230124-Ditylum_brightwellii.AAC.1